MTKITPKPNEIIQAQIAAFTAERVEDSKDRAHIFNNLGSLAVEGPQDITRTLEKNEHVKENGKFVRIPAGTERTVATTEDYTRFLRSVGGAKYEGIAGRAEILKAYGEFTPIINRLRSELADPTKRKEHQAHLGSGSSSSAFSIEQGGKRYAVRVPKGPKVSPATIDSHIAGAYLGKGIPHLEQVVAASYEDGVTVSEVMAGKEMGKLSVEDIQAITNEQLGELVDTLVTANKRGIEIDPKPSNIFYDPKEGFGIVDYHSSKIAGKNTVDQDIGSIAGWMATAIDNAGFYGKPYKSVKTAAEYEEDLEFKKADLEVLERYRSVVESKLTGEAEQTALAEIDKHIVSSKEAIHNLSNPDWVAEQVAKEAEEKRKREELAAERAKNPESGPSGWTTLHVDIV